MAATTNVAATGVSTVDWLASVGAIAVPVYQRQYRWEIDECEQLLDDIRAAASAGDGRSHFIGSILSASGSSGPGAELVLIDGQQRTTTLMLLVAALRHTVADRDPELARELERMLVRGGEPRRTKLRPHRAWAGVFERVVLGHPLDADADSRFGANYTYFRSQIGVEDATLIWRGLQRLEHVAITLGPRANAQQIFESLNSTGAPLRDHELIHNYVLMGLSHDEQLEIEDEYWLPIERATGGHIDAFFRHYLVLTTGREGAAPGERGAIYDAFRQRFPRLDVESLRAHASEWREYAELYRGILEPAEVADRAIGRHLERIAAFGRGFSPLVLLALRDHRRGAIDDGRLAETLELVQSLLVRRTVVGVSSVRLVARLCRAWRDGHDTLLRAFARVMPSDQRVELALRYRPLPHARDLLARLAGIGDASGLDVEHVFPLAPTESWSGDGVRRWPELTEDEQNSLRALAPTLGNLALLEAPLADGAFALPFDAKRARVYSRSTIAGTRELAQLAVWDTAAISERTTRLGREFVRIWPRPATSVGIDDDGLTPILDATRRPGWYPGWDHEYEYVEYRGEHWEVYDVKHLFNRVFKRIWADRPEDVLDFSARHHGPVFGSKAWHGEWDALDDAHFLFMGSLPQHMLASVQDLLDELGLAEEVFLKYPPGAA